jgi:hypothetical protein
MTCFLIRSKNAALSLVCLLLLVLGREVRSEDRSDLLSIVRAQHRAARESIRTLSAEVTVEWVLPNKLTFVRGNYWRSCNTVRVHESYSPASISDKLLKDWEIRTVGRHCPSQDQQDQYRAGRCSAADIGCFFDPW